MERPPGLPASPRSPVPLVAAAALPLFAAAATKLPFMELIKLARKLLLL